MRLVITILGLGLLASLSPSTIIVFMPVVASTRARLNAVAFLIGWGAVFTVSRERACQSVHGCRSFVFSPAMRAS